MSLSLPRVLSPILERALQLFPVVVLTGAQQTGKRTLVRIDRALAKRSYVTLDTEITRSVVLRELKTLLVQTSSDYH